MNVVSGWLAEDAEVLCHDLLPRRNDSRVAIAVRLLDQLEEPLVVARPSGCQNEAGSPEWMSTGMPSSPHFAQTGSSRGSSTAMRSPAMSVGRRGPDSCRS